MLPCVFCRIIRRELDAHVVFEDPQVFAFLDRSPLFLGHTLVVPKSHWETLVDLPAENVGSLFGAAQRLARAMEVGMGADGTFVAINNRVSQSVPHLHVHVVPRKKKDGLRGFFWPRQKYPSEAEMRALAEKIARAAS